MNIVNHGPQSGALYKIELKKTNETLFSEHFQLKGCSKLDWQL